MVHIAPLVNNLKSHIRYPTSIRINNKITQNFYGNQQTGINGSMKSYSPGWGFCTPVLSGATALSEKICGR